MESFGFEISVFFHWLITTTIQASIIICIVMAVKVVFSSRLAPRWHYWLWLLVIVRMVLPSAPQSVFSVFNLIPSRTQVSQNNEVLPMQAETGAVADKYEIEPAPQTVAENSGLGENTAAVLEETVVSDAGSDQAEPVTVINKTPFDFTGLLAFVWITGTVILGLYVFAGNVRLWRIVRQQRPVTDSGVLDLLEDCKRQMNLHTYLSVVETDRVSSPALFGFLRPRLLLPSGILDKLSGGRLRHVFLHELAHLKRGDIYLGWLTAFLQTLHWFNPFVWLAFHKMRTDRELACDQLALKAMQNEDSREYGKTIVSLLEDFSQTQYNPGLAGILEERSQLKRRITMIAKYKKGSYGFSVLAVIVMVFLVAVGLTNARDGSSLDDKKQKARVFVDLLIEERFEDAAANFDKTMKNALPVERLSEVWKATTGQAGPFEKKLGTRADKYLWSDIIYVTCKFQAGPLDIKVVYDRNGMVSGLWFVPVPQGVLEGYANQLVPDEEAKQQSQILYGKAEKIFHEYKAAELEIKRTKIAEALNYYLAAYENAISDSNLAPSAMMMAGICYGHLGDMQSAIEIYEKSIASFPDSSPAVYYYLGEAYQRSGRKNEAVAAMKKCIKLCNNRQSDAFPWANARDALLSLGLNLEKARTAIINQSHQEEPENYISSDRHMKRYFVTIVAGTDNGRIGYEGQQLGWGELTEMLGNLPDRKHTVLEVAFQPELLANFDISDSSKWANNYSFKRAGDIVRELGLEYLSFTGTYDPGSGRGPVSIRTEKEFKLKEEIPVGLQSFEEMPLLGIGNIEFVKHLGSLTGKLKLEVISYPHKFWEIGVCLLDKKGHQVDSVVKNYENSGLVRNIPLSSEDEMKFEFGQTDMRAVDRFEVRLREIIKSKKEPVVPVEKSAALKEGLVGHWKLDGNGDTSAGSSDLTVNGPRMVEGVIGGALAFDGLDDYIIIGNYEEIDLRDSLTLSAWVKNDGDNDGQIIWRGDRRGACDPYELHVFNGKMEFRVDAGSGVDSYRVQSKEKLEDNWHFWAGVYDKRRGRLLLYKDGILENCADIDQVIDYSTSMCWNVIGAVEQGDWQNFRGCIDDVRIYNRALAAEEVKHLYEKHISTENQVKTLISEKPKRLTGTDKGRLFSAFMTIGTSCEHMGKRLYDENVDLKAGDNIDEFLQLCKRVNDVIPEMKKRARVLKLHQNYYL